MPNITLSQLVIYPVKSLGGINVDTLILNEFGPQNDRQWMVVDQRGRFLTQRILPKMCLIATEIHDGELSLSTTTDGEQSDKIDVSKGGGAEREVTVWRDTVIAQDCGDDVADWLTEYLGKASRLVYLPQKHSRTAPKADAGFEKKLAFADAYPLLLTNQQSLDAFNAHLDKPIGMQRFRPNVVITGATAYAEDQWQRLRIDGLELQLTSPCARCVMPSINPATAEKQPDVIDALNKTRRFGTETRFGQNVVYQRPGTLKVGATVEIIE